MTSYQEFRPWGYFVVMNQSLQMSDCKMKRIVVYPKKRLSLQSHQFRNEHWIVLQGKGKAIVGSTEMKLSPGSYVYVPVLTRHRLINDQDHENLEVIEIQTGMSFEEDDIIRYEDDYGRGK